MTGSLVALILAGLALIAAVLWLRWVEATRSTKTTSYRLAFPRNLEPGQVTRFVAGLAGLTPPWWRRMVSAPTVAFEVRATPEGIAHYLIVAEKVEPVVVAHLRAALPGVRATPDDAEPPAPNWAAELRLNTNARSLRTDQIDALAAAILATFHPLDAGEAAIVQWLISPTGPSRLPGGGSRGLLGFLSKTEPDAKAIREAELKRAEPLFLAAGRLGVTAARPGRRLMLLRRMLGAFHLANAPGVHLRVRWVPNRWVIRRIAHRSLPLTAWPAVLNAAELAGLLAFPVKDVVLPGVSLGSARQLPPPAEIPSYGTVLARSTYPGAERDLAITSSDRLRHLHAIGPTGAGKSTLLLNLITQDLAAGHGLVVVDPKSDLVKDVLARVPPHRQADVIVLDPTDTERPVGLNPLAVGPEDAELMVEQVVGIFHRLYADSWGPRTDDILRAALATLGAADGMTLCEVPLLLTDEPFRRRLMGRIDDPVGLEPFWGWYQGLSIAERTNAIGPVLNKLRAFTMRRRIRAVIGQAQPTLDFERVLAERKIVLVSLSKGLLGEEAASLIGALVLARLWQATLARAALPPEQRPPLFCHVDEFQDYLSLPTSIGDMLVQARSFGLGLTLAHQHLAQLPTPLREGVLANARSRVIFQTNAHDARVLARDFAPLEPADLQGLGNYEVALRVALGGRVSSPATGLTPPPPPVTTDPGVVRERSRRRYGRDGAEVDAAIRARHSGTKRTISVGRRRRTP